MLHIYIYNIYIYIYDIGSLRVKHSGNNITVSWPLGPCCSAKGILGRSGKGSEATVRNEYGLEVGTSCLSQTLLFKVRASG